MTGQIKRLFITGATGYVGLVITEFAIKDGFQIRGLSRSESGDDKLRALGAEPVRGDLTTLEVLEKEAAAAGAVIHLASAFTLGMPNYEDIMPIDVAAADAIAAGLEGTNKPFLTTSGTLLVAADPSGAETDETSSPDPKPLSTRGKFDDHVLGFAAKGINVASMRLAPFVYGRGGSGVSMFMGMASKTGALVTVDGSTNHTTTVHVDDAARLYLLALQSRKPGEVYNVSGQTDVKAIDMYKAIAKAVDVPLKDLTFEEASAQFDPITAGFLKAENRASSAKAQKVFGWKPKEMGIVEDIDHGSYQAVAAKLKSEKA